MEKNLHKHLIWVRLIPLAILLLILVAFFYFRVYEYMSLTALKNYRVVLQQLVSQHQLLSVLIFIVVYTLAVAVSMPNAVILTLIGGFLFGPFLGCLYVIIGATLGATIIFLAGKTALHELLTEKAGKWVGKMSKGFQDNATSYMIFLRLVPIFPFWLVNIVPGLLGIRTRTFVITTFFGIIPGTFVYSLLGNGLGEVLDYNKPLDFNIIFRLEILAPLLGLALLSLVPIIYKKLKQRRNAR